MTEKPLREKRKKHGAAEEDILLSNIAAAIGEPARTRILLSLMDGHARTSTELSAIAEVTPSTASAHLSRLAENHLVCASVQGRHRYYSLRGSEVASVLEGLGVVAGTTVSSFVPSAPQPLRQARTCYDHMAGTLSVQLLDYFLQERWLVANPDGGEGAYCVGEAGRKSFELFGIDLETVQSRRRLFAYACMDWSERKPHLAGSLGAAVLTMTLGKRWVFREPDSRALAISRTGQREIWKRFGIAV